MSYRHAILILVALMLATTTVASASGNGSVQVKTLADGTTFFYNESKVQRTRRTSSQLVNIPSRDLERLIDRWSRQRGLDPRLVQAVMQAESGYNIRAKSSKGAMGLMQLMPATARELGVKNPWDAEDNVKGGTLYLRWMLDQFDGNTTLALAAYNAGPTAVSRFGGVPPYKETQHYVAKVLGLWHGAPPPQYLQELARDDAKRRARLAEKKERDEPTLAGAKVYVTRDANGAVVFTTERPD
ncbi:MAG: lytic transglycosylase domain-containing protein [Acidobacteriota bacterium]